jgi:hypothetical protein
MRPVLIAAVVLSSAVTAAEAQRPSTLSMSCQQAQSLVAKRGAVVLSTGAHTYDRFVSSGRYCQVAEYAYDGFAPTRDRESCLVGYVCKNVTPPWFEDDDDFFGGRMFQR